MSTEEFSENSIEKSIIELENEFFLGTLKSKERNGEFRVRINIVAPQNPLFLFQYKNRMIASAVYKGTCSIISGLDKKYDEIYNSGYRFCHFFFPETIRIFKPITPEEFKKLKILNSVK